MAKQALAALFADAKGITMKVGQLFAGSDVEDPLQSLVTTIQPMPLKRLLPVLEQDLGQTWRSVFRSIDEASAAASLGQVHFAVLNSGEAVAVKIRYPNIDDAVAAELQLAGLVPGLGPIRRWGFDLEAYKHCLQNNMHRELDYCSEAERQLYFRHTVQVPGLKIPNIYRNLCSKRILVQERVQGVSLQLARNWSYQDRYLIGQTLALTLFKSLFVAGEVHADPHPGNILYSHDDNGRPIVNLLDFGCTVPVQLSRRLALLQLLIACREQNQCVPLQNLVAVGFDAKKLKPISASLPALCSLLFKPFLVNHPFAANDWQLKQGFSNLLGEERWWFRAAGPADLFLLLRAFQGLLQQVEQLQIQLSWWSLLLQAVDEEYLQQARAYAPPLMTEQFSMPLLSFAGQAKQLCVNVTEAQQSKVSVTMPAEAVFDLATIVPADVLERLNETNEHELAHLLSKLRQTGLVPQQLFNIAQGDKVVRVWLQ